MFCIHCGAKGAADYCPTCGRRQVAAVEAENCDVGPRFQNPDTNSEILVATLVETDSLQYESLIADPEARERIAAAGRLAPQGVTSEDLLAVFDAVSPIGISLGKFTTAILPIYDKLGIKTSRYSQGLFDAPPTCVMLAVLCTLATKGLGIAKVHQDKDKCSLIADIPPGLITNRGQMAILIAAHAECVQVSLATTISGQWYDWGKSQRMMDEFFTSIRTDLTNQQQGQAPRYRRVA